MTRFAMCFLIFLTGIAACEERTVHVKSSDQIIENTPIQTDSATYQPDNSPNVILITADDLGVQLSSYGDPILQTPHIDSLAADGVLFSNAYVTQPSCSPSRSSILTGTYPHQNGQLGLSHTGFSITDEIATLPELLKSNGYRTGIIGKLHVAPMQRFPFDFADMLQEETRDVNWVAGKAREFIDASRERFFLYVNFSDPHVKAESNYDEINQVNGVPDTPFDKDTVEPFIFQKINDDEELTRISGYYNCVARLDVAMKNFLDLLKKTGSYDNSLIIFVGDHGAPFSRSKASCYEAGVRVPFILKLPGQRAAVPADDSLVSTVDILSTVLDVCGIALPDGVAGYSLKPLYLGENTKWRSHLFTEFNFHTDSAFFPRRAVTDGTYKLIHNLIADIPNPITGVDGDPAYRLSKAPVYDNSDVRQAFDTLVNPPEFELYDLKNDPVEFYNLADSAEHAPIMAELKSELMAWRIETEDPFLQPEVLAAAQRGAQGN